MELSTAVELPSPPRMGGSTPKPLKKQSPKARPKQHGTKAAKTHPSYSQMVKEAITALKDRKGSSRVAILKYISGRYQLGNNGKRVHSQLRLAIKRGIASGKFTLAKGAGVNGSFRLGAKDGSKTKEKSRKQKKTSRKEKKANVGSAPKKPRMKTARTTSNSPKQKLKAKKPRPKVSRPKKATS